MRKQSGVSLGGLLIGVVILILLAMVGLKVGPAYTEFLSVKKAIVSTAGEKGGVAELRKAFDRKAQIDNISVISGNDLEITKEGSDVVVSFNYRKEVPLFWNIGLYLDFAANSKGID